MNDFILPVVVESRIETFEAIMNFALHISPSHCIVEADVALFHGVHADGSSVHTHLKAHFQGKQQHQPQRKRSKPAIAYMKS